MSHISMSDVHIKGYAKFFSRHRWLNLLEVLGNPPTHPQHPAERLYFRNLAPKFKYMAPKFKYLAPKLKYVAPKLKYVAPKIKYLIQNSNQSIFVPLKNLPLLTRKTPNPSSLSPTHPALGVSKKLKCILLATYTWVTHIDMSHVIMIYIYIIYVGHYDMTHFDVGRSFVCRSLIDMWFIMTWVTSSWSLIYESCLNDLHIHESRHYDPHINESCHNDLHIHESRHHGRSFMSHVLTTYI